MDERNQDFMNDAIHEFIDHARAYAGVSDWDSAQCEQMFETKYINGFNEHDDQDLTKMSDSDIISELIDENIDRWFYYHKLPDCEYVIKARAGVVREWFYLCALERAVEQ